MRTHSASAAPKPILRRAELSDFVEQAMAMSMAGDNPELGAEQPYRSDRFLLRATPVNDLSGYEIEPTITDWPQALPDLAGAADCIEVPADELRAMFEQANQLTLFTDQDVQYQLAVKPLLAGDSC